MRQAYMHAIGIRMILVIVIYQYIHTSSSIVTEISISIGLGSITPKYFIYAHLAMLAQIFNYDVNETYVRDALPTHNP